MWATIEGVQMKGGELGSVVIVPALDPWARAESEGGFPPLERMFPALEAHTSGSLAGEHHLLRRP